MRPVAVAISLLFLATPAAGQTDKKAEAPQKQDAAVEKADKKVAKPKAKTAETKAMADKESVDLPPKKKKGKGGNSPNAVDDDY